MAKFSKGEAITYGWGMAMRHLGFFVVALILVGVASAVPSRLQAWTKGSMPFLSLLFGLATLALGQLVSIGVTRIALKLHDNQTPEYGDLFNGFPLFFQYLFATLLYAIIVAIGLLLLVVPGIIAALRLGLYGFLVVDKGLGAPEALMRSAELTRGSVWNLFLLSLLSLGIMILGFLALFVGAFVAIPTVLMAAVFVYRKLLVAAEGPALAPQALASDVAVP